jgi:hypothetical protein
MRGKIGGGAYLDKTLVSLPHSSPATHGSGAAAAPAGGPVQPNLFPPGGQPSNPPAPTQPNGGQTPPDQSTGSAADAGNIFGPGGSARKTYQSEKPTSALNLLSQIEKWGVNAGANVANVTLVVNVTTGAQLAALIKKLPTDGVLWDLQLEKED